MEWSHPSHRRTIPASDQRMAHFTFGWPPMDTAAIAALTGAVPLPSPAAEATGAAYCANPALYASVPPRTMQPAPAVAEAEAARRRRELEAAAIRLVHLLVTCAGTIQAGDYSAAHANLAEAHVILGAISTAKGIGRVGDHFAAALSHRLFPAYPLGAPPHPSAAAPAELFRHFYEAGPHLKFVHSTANQAIVDAFEGCDRVHIIDFSLMQGAQWPGLIYALAKRDGGPPSSVRLTGIGPPPTGARDVLREVGLRLAELARSLDVPFFFRGVCADQLDSLRPWMFDVVPGEAVAVNSVLQLHRLVVDPDADPAVPAPIDVLLDWVIRVQPRVFTVVEQEADHNKPSLLERFTNALFHYAAMFHSMEAVGCRNVGGGGGADIALAEAYLRAEIFDIVCGEGSSRAERHEPVGRWRERLARAGLTQLPFGAVALHQATAQLLRLTSPSGSGFGVLECDGSLALGWHDRPLYSVTAWRATGGHAAGFVAGRDKGKSRSESNGSAGNLNLATARGAGDETALP